MARLDNQEAVRQEILRLLRLQVDALDSPAGVTDKQLEECYARQTCIQELREQLEACCPGPEERFSVSNTSTAAPDTALSNTPVSGAA